ncbi:MAG: hypothetical protein LUD77_02015 [Clostridiales bacterium]|nr:hypothetical protein [Clostridiales bacterium]
MSEKQSNEKLIEKLQAKKKGTPTAKAILSELLERNERLVETFIHRFTGLKKSDPDFEDVKQQSYFAFYAAAYTFDTSKGYAFSTYLYFYIQKESGQAYYNSGFNIRIPRNMRSRIKKMYRLKSEAEAERGHKVNNEEILKEMGLSEESTKLTLSAIEKLKTISLYKPLKSGEVEETNISDTIVSEFDLESNTIEQVWLTELREYLFKSLKGLSQVKQNIIIQHFLLIPL